MRFLLSFVASFALIGPAVAQPKLPNLPPDLMAPTDPLSPADERKQFTLPPGFDVQLVASEPDIQKPMQMAWDAKGRLWVTTSYHYPFAVAEKPTDKVFVLADFDPLTGKAKKVTTFTADLNIPIGVLPLPDGKSVLVSSVGEIRKYKINETEQGPKADGHEVLFKGFGVKDTHGMYNSYTLMPDGWVYSCHGFANDSTVKDKSGNEIKMQSGHTFRFKPDGSKIEVWTRGQVNPFGMTVDPWFNLYTADCHSKPITQLIPGAYYDSFGKPHDGLGFAPHVTAHSHNSTGLCGLAWYDADHFPKDYPGTMFVGNVVTNRINFDRIEWRGASPVAKELPDFLVSKDRWFRPVDIKLGPDGALYVADFYNKIIGHYEVDLKDPRRDKGRGRVWRIVWTGKDGKGVSPKPAYSDLTKETPAELVKRLEDPNLAVRLAAINQLGTRTGDWVSAFPHQKGGNDAGVKSPARVYAMFPMLAEAQGKMDNARDYTNLHAAITAETDNRAVDELLAGLGCGLRARQTWDADARKIAIALLSGKSVHGKRAAMEAVAAHPHADFVPVVIEVLKTCIPEDAHLRQIAKIALRNCFNAAPDSFADQIGKDEKTDLLLAEVLLGARTTQGAEKLVALVHRRTLPAPALASAAGVVGQYGESAVRERLITKLLARPNDIVQNADPMLSLLRGVQARGVKLTNSELSSIFLGAEALLYGVNQLWVKTNREVPTEDVQRVRALLRVIAFLPAVVEPGELAKLQRPLGGPIAQLAEHTKAALDLRAACAEASFVLDAQSAYEGIRKLLAADTTPELRERLLVVFAGSGHREARLDARDALKTVPYRTAVPIGLALAGTKAGAEDLLVAVQEGKAPTRLLQEKAILERLKASNANDWQKRVNDLTKNIPPADQRIADVIKKRSAAFASAKVDKAEGAKLFAKHCAACHRIGDQGGKIAPQLDGVGVRGAERLLEDILDPNRNVDQAFRARSITLTSDKTLTALMLRVEGKVLVVADLEGKEQRIPLDEIATNRETMLSAMPANFADVVPEADLYQIVAYLLDQKAKEPKKE